MTPRAQSTPLFMETMYKSGAIEKMQFSFYLSNYFKACKPGSSDYYFCLSHESSKLTIGGYNLKYAKPNFDIIWNKVIPGQNYWITELKAVFLYTNQKSGNLHTKSTLAILDSGTSNLIMPIRDYKALLRKFKNDYNVDFEPFGAQAKCLCDEGLYATFPDLKI